MNFLAHLWLSGDDDDLKIGNYIGDFVKGNQVYQYPDGIQKGILLHRRIDHFTDTHPVVKESKIRLRPKYRHYAPVIVDMFYDHLLAAHWNEWADVDLKEYTTDFYEMAWNRLDILPGRVHQLLTHMSATDWLYSYQFIEGIDRALQGMSRRTRFDSGMDRAVDDLKKDYALFLQEFRAFFPELTDFCKNG